MAKEWHYAIDGEKHGPVTSQQLKELAASGDIQPTDLVWTSGNQQAASRDCFHETYDGPMHEEMRWLSIVITSGLEFFPR